MVRHLNYLVFINWGRSQQVAVKHFLSHSSQKGVEFPKFRRQDARTSARRATTTPLWTLPFHKRYVSCRHENIAH